MTPIPRRLNLLLCGAALAVAASCTTAPMAEKSAVPRQFPIRDFFSNPERAFFRLSEDGRTLGFMQPVSIDGAKRRLNVYVQPLEGSQPIPAPIAELKHGVSITDPCLGWETTERILMEGFRTLTG